jgi:ABC-type sugar transport system permease subunit
MKKTFFLLFAALCLFSTLVSASVGMGISPSRTEYRIEGGKTLETTYMVYNTGTDDLIARFSADGDIKPYVQFVEKDVYLQKEEDITKFPPPNAKRFTVRYTPPTTSKSKRITGFVVASGGPGAGSTLGGNVAVAMRVDILIEPTKRFWDYITNTQWIVGSSILAVLFISILLVTIARKKGISLKIELNRKSRKP